MFQFGRFPRYSYGFTVSFYDMTRRGFPHSDISGSKHICCSPKLIAAYRVLHRLPMPRHSPCALFRLNYSPLAFANFVPYMSFANRFFFANCNTITCCTEKPYSDLKLSFLLDLRFFCLSAFADFDLSSLSVFSFQSTSADLSAWWAQMDSNHRPRAYQARALTN